MSKKKRIFLYLLCVAILGVIGAFIGYRFTGSDGSLSVGSETPRSFLISAPDLVDKVSLDTDNTCAGEDVNPKLAIQGIPRRTESMVLVMHNPSDVDEDFTNWLLWNIPPDATTLEANAVPSGAKVGLNGDDIAKYAGPCSPLASGVNHFVIELYALDKILDLPDESDREAVESAIKDSIIEKTTFTLLYNAG